MGHQTNSTSTSAGGNPFRSRHRSSLGRPTRWKAIRVRERHGPSLKDGRRKAVSRWPRARSAEATRANRRSSFVQRRRRRASSDAASTVGHRPTSWTKQRRWISRTNVAVQRETRTPRDSAGLGNDLGNAVRAHHDAAHAYGVSRAFLTEVARRVIGCLKCAHTSSRSARSRRRAARASEISGITISSAPRMKIAGATSRRPI